MYKLKLARRTVASASASSSALQYFPAFLEVVLSEQTSGLVTEAALSAVHKLLQLEVLGMRREGTRASSGPGSLFTCPGRRAALEADQAAREVMNSIVSSVTHCRFEASDPASDEVVLMKLLKVLLACMRCSSQAQLTDEGVCEIVQACFRICAQPRLSVLLRRTAETALLEIVWILFARLHEMVDAAYDRWDRGLDGAGPRQGPPGPGSGGDASAPADADRLSLPGAAQGLGASASSRESAGDLWRESDSALPSPRSPRPIISQASHGVHVERGMAFELFPATRPEEQPAAIDLPEASAPAQAPQDVAVAPVAPIASGEAAPAIAADDSRLGGRGDVVAFGSGQDRPPPVPALERRPSPPTRRPTPRSPDGPLRAASVAGDDVTAGPSSAIEEEDAVGQPHGLDCAFEVLRFLCSLVEPASTNGDNTPEVHALGLSLTRTALEAGGSAFARCPPLLELIGAHLCRSLVQISNTTNLTVLSLVLQCTNLLSSELSQCLRPQFDIILQRVLLRLVHTEKGAGAEVAELTMESLLDVCELPYLAVQLFASYDCAMTSDDCLARLVDALSSVAAPEAPITSPAALTQLNALALDGMVALLRGLAACAVDRRAAQSSAQGLERARSMGASSSGAGTRDWRDPLEIGAPLESMAAALRRSRAKKMHLRAGVEAFNRKAKEGLAYLQRMGLLPEPLEAGSVAAFLRTAPDLEKGQVGDYLGDNSAFHLAVLRAFAATFDFAGRDIDVALRIFLEGFKLPGEAQKIDRIVEVFAIEFYGQSAMRERGTPFKHPDAAHILAYSIIMLNTDQHNAQVKQKMTCDEFVRNNRGACARPGTPSRPRARAQQHAHLPAHPGVGSRHQPGRRPPPPAAVGHLLLHFAGADLPHRRNGRAGWSQGPASDQRGVGRTHAAAAGPRPVAGGGVRRRASLRAARRPLAAA